MKLLSLFCVVLAALEGVNGLATPTKSARAVDQAVGLYQKRYPKPRGPRKRAFNAGLGIPVADIDGTKLNVARDSVMGKTFADRDEKDLRATFQEMVKVYGEAQSLQMVKDDPLVLAANRKNFKPTLSAFAEKFGLDESKAMVSRNPGLLFIAPSGPGGADTATDLTMQFSYLVAATRPVGPLLLYGTLFLLVSPAIEAVTGLPIQTSVLTPLCSVIPGAKLCWVFLKAH